MDTPSPDDAPRDRGDRSSAHGDQDVRRRTDFDRLVAELRASAEQVNRDVVQVAARHRAALEACRAQRAHAQRAVSRSSRRAWQQAEVDREVQHTAWRMAHGEPRS